MQYIIPCVTKVLRDGLSDKFFHRPYGRANRRIQKIRPEIMRFQVSDCGERLLAFSLRRSCYSNILFGSECRDSLHKFFLIRKNLLRCRWGPTQRETPCCGARNFLFAERSQNFDRCHSLTSLHLPLAALGSLPTGLFFLSEILQKSVVRVSRFVA